MMLCAVSHKTKELGEFTMLTIEEFEQHIVAFAASRLAQGSPHTSKAYTSDLLQYGAFLRSHIAADAEMYFLLASRTSMRSCCAM